MRKFCWLNDVKVLLTKSYITIPVTLVCSLICTDPLTPIKDIHHYYQRIKIESMYYRPI